MNLHSLKLFRATTFFILMGLFITYPSWLMASTNLIENGDLEIVSSDSPSYPQGWIRGHWGINEVTFSYPASGVDGSKAVEVEISAHTSGDAKWTSGFVSVMPGRTYTYTDDYKSSVKSFVTLEYVKSDGTRSYPDLGVLDQNSLWSKSSFSFTVPPGVNQLRVFHLINKVGILSVDNASLTDTTPIPTSNLINNPSLEIFDANNLPTNWIQGRWGTNTASFSYPVESDVSSRGARVSISSYTNGDAKWAFDPVIVKSGKAYEFSDYYKSSVTTYVTVQFRGVDGSTSYLDIGEAPPSSSWVEFKSSFIVPVGVTSLTVFHVINNLGSLSVDNFSLKETNLSDPVKFDKGYVSLQFDDGHRSVYENALPILENAGFKSDQFITTNYVLNNFPGYMTVGQVLDMQSKGHLIGAHTKSHSDLTLLSKSERENEIKGSRDDLLNMGASPVNFFAYPFGAYNDEVKQSVKDAGFLAARSSDGGYNDKNVSLYALWRKPMVNTTTFAEVKGYIDTAMANKTWLILLFHEVDNNGHTYAVTPALLQEIVDYLKNVGVAPITMDQGLELMRGR